MGSTLRISSAVLAALILGVCLGSILGRTPAFTPVTIRSDDRSLVPVVQIDGVREGQLTGTLQGDVRFFFGDRVVIAGSGGVFRVPVGSLLENSVIVRVPQGMQYVASRRGKKYYPVNSSAGGKLAPQNRVYFGSAEEAERAGFIRGN